MSFYNVVSESEESTVVSEYKSEEKRSDAYQSEEELEKEFIHLLTEMSYEYLPIHNKDELLPNLRKKLEELNNYSFTDTEWEQFYNNCIAGKNDGIVEKRGVFRKITCRFYTATTAKRKILRCSIKRIFTTTNCR